MSSTHGLEPSETAPDIRGELTAGEKDEIMKMSALGLTPPQIASALGFAPDMAALFVRMADTPGSDIDRMLAEGRCVALADPQIKLHEAASAGNIEAVKELQKITRANRFNELVYYMDDDESACQTLAH